MVEFSPVAQQPSSGIEDRFIHSFIADIYIAPLQFGLLRSAPLQAIQEILRRSDQQTIIAIDL